MPPLQPCGPHQQCLEVPGTQIGSNRGHNDPICPEWALDVQNLTEELSTAEIALLDQHMRSKPLTTDMLLASTLHCVETYNRSQFQETLRKLDPLFAHIRSFSSIVDIFVQTNPRIPGLVWGGLHLAITVCCRKVALFEKFVELLRDFTPVMSFFSRSKKLFEQMNVKDLQVAIQAVCKEMVSFCLGVVKHCKRNAIVNCWRMLLQPSVEVEFRLYNERLKKQIAIAEKEVRMCEMQATQQVIREMKKLVRDTSARQPPSSLPKKLEPLIPYCQNERFFGRRGILDDLSKALDPARLPKSQRRFALYGLGGCGKTQIALEYVYSHYDAYEVILWISSSSMEKIEKAFVEAAGRLGLEEPMLHANEARQYTLKRLSEIDTTYLIVFDDVEDLALIRSYWPHTNYGSILITSRDMVVSKTAFRLSAAVPEFTIDEGCRFLLTLLPRATTFGAEVDIKKITTMLGGLPLALSQVVAYILGEECQVDTFLKEHHDQRKWQEFAAVSVLDYDLNLTTVWKLSLSTLTPSCQHLLDILTFLDPDEVPYKLLTDGALSQSENSAGKCGTSAHQSRLRFLADQHTFQGLLLTLRRQSLIRTNSPSSSFTIHRLVQEYASHRLSVDSDRERAVFADALSILGSTQPKDDCTRHWSPHLWDTALDYLPHVRALESRFRQKPAAFGGNENGLAKLLFNCANYLFERNRYTIGLEIIVSARATATAAGHPDYKLLADLHRLEGRLCNEANLPERGLEAFEQAFRLTNRAIEAGQLELSDTRLVRTMTGWGNCLNQLGRFDAALEMQLRASQTCAQDPERHGDAQSIVMLNLGYVYFRRGELDKAETTLRETKTLDAKLQPVSYALANLAILRGKLEEGLTLHLEALQLYVEQFGEQHQCVADSLFKVGETYLKMDMLSQATSYLLTSLTMYRSEGQHFDARAAISRGARMLAVALERQRRHRRPLEEEQGQEQEEPCCGGGSGCPPDVSSPGDLRKEAFELHEELTGRLGSVVADTDEAYSALLFYWSR